MWHWLVSVTGICLGNTLWFFGLIVVGLGVWGLVVEKDTIIKTVGAMSLMTGGQPRGFALKLKGLVDPVDRRKSFGRNALLAGIVCLIIGCSLISRCAG